MRGSIYRNESHVDYDTISTASWRLGTIVVVSAIQVHCCTQGFGAAKRAGRPYCVLARSGDLKSDVVSSIDSLIRYPSKSNFKISERCVRVDRMRRGSPTFSRQTSRLAEEFADGKHCGIFATVRLHTVQELRVVPRFVWCVALFSANVGGRRSCLELTALDSTGILRAAAAANTNRQN